MSNIEWTNETWNCVTGCQYTSEGCRFCYAAAMSKRLAAMGQEKYQGIVGKGHFNGVVKTWDDELTRPLRWKKPKMIFVNSMSDTFHKDVPFEFIDQIFLTIEKTPWHTYQILTKRPDRMAEYMTRHVRDLYDNAITLAQLAHVWPLSNVWLGTSVENQAAADERVPHLLRCPASVRFISQEPQLDHVVYCDEWAPGLAQIIIGGESGPGARPFNIAWAYETIAWCRRHHVAPFVKQLGAKPYFHERRSQRIDRPGLKMSFESLEVDYTLALKDRKGGDMSEWPEAAKVREFPDAIST